MSSKDDPESTAALLAGQVAPVGEGCPATHPIKGNQNSDRELIYHVPGGRFYERTHPETCFASEATARAAGYRPPKGAAAWTGTAATAEVPTVESVAIDTTAPVDGLPVVDMFVRLVRFNLSQGFVELAEKLTDQVAPILRRQPGFRSLTLLSDDTSGEYIFLTHWDTLEHINTFERSPDEWRVRDIMSEHLTAVPQIEVYQLHNLAHREAVNAG